MMIFQSHSGYCQWPFQALVIPCEVKSIWCDIQPPGRSQAKQQPTVVGTSPTCSSTEWEQIRSTLDASNAFSDVHGAMYLTEISPPCSGRAMALRIAEMRRGAKD